MRWGSGASWNLPYVFSFLRTTRAILRPAPSNSESLDLKCCHSHRFSSRARGLALPAGCLLSACALPNREVGLFLLSAQGHSRSGKL